MTKRVTILDPLCERCKQPMVWMGAQLVNDDKVNVFRCQRCDKMEAQATSLDTTTSDSP